MYVCVRVSDPLELELYSYKLPCGCWELNPSPPQEQAVLLTTEPSFQPTPALFISSQAAQPGPAVSTHTQPSLGDAYGEERCTSTLV